MLLLVCICICNCFYLFCFSISPSAASLDCSTASSCRVAPPTTSSWWRGSEWRWRGVTTSAPTTQSPIRYNFFYFLFLLVINLNSQTHLYIKTLLLLIRYDRSRLQSEIDWFHNSTNLSNEPRPETFIS